MILPEELKNIEFLRHLSVEHLHQIAKMARLQETKENDVVFLQGEGSSFIYFVLSGKVSLQIEEPGGAAVDVSRVGPGELLGWSPMLGRHAMTATARALTPCRLAALDVDQVLELCDKDPRLGVAFLRQIAVVLSERLWSARRNLSRAMTNRPQLPVEPEGSD